MHIETEEYSALITQIGQYHFTDLKVDTYFHLNE